MSLSAVIAFDPSKAQRLWLLDLLHGMKPAHTAGTRDGLHRRGLIDADGKLTKAGRVLARELHNNAEASELVWMTRSNSVASRTREGKRRRIAALKEKIKARLATTLDIAERQSLLHELELADLRLELIAAKEDPGDL